MSMTGMLAAVAKAAAADDTENEDIKDCSCNPEDPNYSPDCDCGDTAEKPDDEEDKDKMSKAVLAERTRVLGIAAAAFPGQDKLALSLINKGANLGNAALAFNADHKAKGAKVMANLDADEVAVKGLRSEPANGADAPKSPTAGLTGEALWKADFSGSAELQAEFGGKEANYLAFKRAEASGQARILNKTTG